MSPSPLLHCSITHFPPFTSIRTEKRECSKPLKVRACYVQDQTETRKTAKDVSEISSE